VFVGRNSSWCAYTSIPPSCLDHPATPQVVERLGGERGIDTKALITKLKKEHRWHVETA